MLDTTPYTLGTAAKAQPVTNLTPLPMQPRDAAGNPLGTAANPTAVGGISVVASDHFNRPADTVAYASGDLMANNTSAGSVTPLQFSVARVASGSGMIRRARLKKSTTVATNAIFRLHLYGVTPATIINGDNGAWSTSQSTYLGSFDLDMTGTTARVFTDGVEVIAGPSAGSEINFQLAAGLIVYGLLEARAGYAPGNAETFTGELEVLQN